MSERPAWWRENEALREELDLPEYEPPRFADGTYTHEVVDDLGDRLGCRLRFVGYDTEYPDDWVVEADGESLFSIGRHRDSSGNTVYEMGAETFARRVADSLETGHRGDADGEGRTTR